MLLTNPVVVAVLVLSILCLFKMNVLLSMLIAALVGGMVGGMNPVDTMKIMISGMGSNMTTALSYILLGTFATAMVYTGITDVVGRKITDLIKGQKLILLAIIGILAVFSQNLVPVHIAFIPILIPPLLHTMNKMKLDRRAAASSLVFGLKATYIALPVGFGFIFQGIVAENMTANGMAVNTLDVWKSNWLIAVAMFVGLLIAVFISYNKPREYENVEVEQEESLPDKMNWKHYVTLISILVMVVIQVAYESLPLASIAAILILVGTGVIKWKDLDDQFAGGIKLMGFIAFVMLVAGGMADVLKATGGVEQLVNSSLSLMQGSKIMAATMITLVGLLVTMGIGTSFGTVPILAVLYVPLCQKIGFSIPATVLLISAAAALGDAGSPASDTTLGPTSGLNADGQHNHIWDTCVPSFLHYNIPIMLFAIVGAQFL